MKVFIVFILAVMLSIPAWSSVTTGSSANSISTWHQAEEQLADDFCLRKDGKCKVVSWNS